MTLTIETRQTHGMFKGKHTYQIVSLKYSERNLSCVEIKMMGHTYGLSIHDIISLKVED